MITASPPNISIGRRNLGRFNVLAAALLLIAGGLVTSTSSGMAVPDWPLSYGRWLPAMTGGVFYEHGHRMIAAVVGFSILIMAFWTQFSESRPGVRRLAWWTLALVCLQGFLGAITVFYNLPFQVSAAHATLGQTVFCLLVVMAECLRSDDLCSTACVTRDLRWLGGFCVFALLCQLIVGAVMRHGGSGLWPHLLGAAIAAPAVGFFAASVLLLGDLKLQRPAVGVLVVLAVQLALGLATADFRTVPNPRTDWGMIVVATTHLAFGALLLGSSVLLTFRLFQMRTS